MPPPHSTSDDTPSRGSRPWQGAVRRAGGVGRFLCHDPLPVGGIAVALLVGTAGLLGLAVDGPLLVVAFCGTALVYNADRTLGLSPEDLVNRPNRVAWVRRHRRWLRVEALMLGAGAAAFAPFLQMNTLIGAAVVGGIASTHLLPLLPGTRRLKATGAVKTLAVAGAWSVGAVVLPVLEATPGGGGAGVTTGVGALAAYRFTFIAPNVLLADWADREGDAAAGLQAWTGRWSPVRVRMAGTALLAAGGMGAAAAVAGFGAPQLLLVDAAGLAVMAAAVHTLRPGTSPLHALLLDLAVAWPVVTWGVGRLELGN